MFFFLFFHQLQQKRIPSDTYKAAFPVNELRIKQQQQEQTLPNRKQKGLTEFTLPVQPYSDAYFQMKEAIM